MSEILKVSDAVKIFGNGSVSTRALDGISFAIEKGEFVAVMGPSGSGKSTLLNVISTIESLSSGKIIADGINISSIGEKELADFRRDKLGFIFQEYNLLDTLTVEENIALPLNLKKEGAKETKEKVLKVSEALGVTDQLAKFPSALSGGQRQRVACARAVITSPALILADEPTGALDSRSSKMLMEQLCLMNQKLGATILMVTHDAAVASYAQRVIFLCDGRIYNEIFRGEKEQKEFRHDILAITETLGGGEEGAF